MTAHNSRNASNSRNKSNNRRANTVGTEPKVGLLVIVVKQQHGGGPATAGTVLTAEITAAAGTIVGPPDLDGRKVGNSTVEKTAILSGDTATAAGGHN